MSTDNDAPTAVVDEPPRASAPPSAAPAESSAAGVRRARANRVKVPALLVYIAFLAAGIVLDRQLALPFPGDGAVSALGTLVLAAGLVLVVWTLLQFLFARVSPASFGPTRRLIVTGPFAWSRHPLYTGGLAAYVGAALLGGWTLTLLGAVPLALVIRRFFMEREEAYLEDQFGDEYRHYATRVRRWI